MACGGIGPCSDENHEETAEYAGQQEELHSMSRPAFSESEGTPCSDWSRLDRMSRTAYAPTELHEMLYFTGTEAKNLAALLTGKR